MACGGVRLAKLNNSQGPGQPPARYPNENTKGKREMKKYNFKYKVLATVDSETRKDRYLSHVVAFYQQKDATKEMKSVEGSHGIESVQLVCK